MQLDGVGDRQVAVEQVTSCLSFLSYKSSLLGGILVRTKWAITPVTREEDNNILNTNSVLPAFVIELDPANNLCDRFYKSHFQEVVQGHTVCNWQAGFPGRLMPVPFHPVAPFLLCSVLSTGLFPPFEVQVWLQDPLQPQEGAHANMSLPGLQMERGLAGACWRWGHGWLEAPLPIFLRSGGGSGRGGAGTEASRQRAWFIKSHQEHCPGTAVIYPHFFLVKCYWLFYTKGSLSWMGCTGIQFTSTFCQLCFFPPLLLKLYMVLREEAIFYLREKKSWRL